MIKYVKLGDTLYIQVPAGYSEAVVRMGPDSAILEEGEWEVHSQSEMQKYREAANLLLRVNPRAIKSARLRYQSMLAATK